MRHVKRLKKFVIIKKFPSLKIMPFILITIFKKIRDIFRVIWNYTLLSFNIMKNISVYMEDASLIMMKILRCYEKYFKRKLNLIKFYILNKSLFL